MNREGYESAVSAATERRLSRERDAARRAASAWKALAKKYRAEVESWKSVADEGADEEAWLERTLDAVREHCKTRIAGMNNAVRIYAQDSLNTAAILTAGAHGHALKSVLAILDAAEKTRGR